MTSPIILPYRGIMPKIAPNAFIAPGAVIIGDVEIGSKANIWFGCVIRGDVQSIRIGEGTNVQDGTVIHVTRGDGPTIIGKGITIGHSALLHACTVEDEVLVGIGAILLDGCHIGARSIIAAGALVTKGTHIPEGSLVMGAPAKVVRVLSADERTQNKRLALKYVELSRRYLSLRTDQ